VQDGLHGLLIVPAFVINRGELRHQTQIVEPIEKSLDDRQNPG